MEEAPIPPPVTSQGDENDPNHPNNAEATTEKDEEVSGDCEMPEMEGQVERPLLQECNRESDEDMIGFHETIYTMLYVSKPKSAPFVFALAIYVLQTSLIVLALADTIDIREDTNTLKIPPNVNPAVHWAQGLIVIFIVAFQQDLTEALVKWHNGPHPDLLADPNVGATKWSFYGSCVGQVFTGTCLLFTIFILSMQATTVVGLMLNFAALHFLSEIDDLSYSLAKNGFVYPAIRKQTEAISQYRVVDHAKDTKLTFRIVFFYGVVAVLVVSFFFVKLAQVDGNYICDRVYVQFGDDYNPNLAHYSGIFEPQDKFTFETRDYVDALTRESILLAFCDDEQSWTFSYKQQGKDSEEPCKRAFAKSSRTISYDVTTIPTSGWSVRYLGTDEFVPIDFMEMVCIDDFPSADIGSEGLQQTFSESPCEELHVDGRSENFPQSGNPLAHKFHILKHSNGSSVTAYGCPIYYSDAVDPANYIVFTGRRWVLLNEDGFKGDLSDDMFQRQFLQGVMDWKPLFLSAAADFNTRSFQPSPAGLNWFPVVNYALGGSVSYGPDYVQTPPSTKLLCSECTDDSSCLNGGVCDLESRQCNCTDDFTSGICEQYVACFDQAEPCHNLGICDEINGSCRCEPPSFGRLCESDYLCYEEQGLCLNGGLCIEDFNSSKAGLCSCPDPATFGPFCEIHSDCTVAGCSNEGVCDSETRVCTCTDGFSGLMCDIAESSPCDESNCRNGTACSQNGDACIPDQTNIAHYDCANDVDCFRCYGDEDCNGQGFCSVYGQCQCSYLIYITGGNCGFVLTTSLFDDDGF